MDPESEVSEFDSSEEERDIQKLEYINALCDYESKLKDEAALTCNENIDKHVRIQSQLAECRRRHYQLLSSVCCTDYAKEYVCGFPVRDDEDTLSLNKLQMYNCSGMVCAQCADWTIIGKRFINAVIYKMSKDIKKKELSKQISNLVSENKTLKTNRNNKTISILKRKMSRVDKMPLKALALPIDGEYDWDQVATELNNRYSAQDCRSLWKLFLHPTVRKIDWAKSKHICLPRNDSEHSLKGWDDISKKLGTGRKNYKCSNIQTKIKKTITKRKWTKEEEEYLRRLVQGYKMDKYIPWGKVAAAMDKRTKAEVHDKFRRLTMIRRGKFFPEEDSLLLTCVRHFGPNFRKVVAYLQGRSITQCRQRYYTLMKNRVWTVEEDRRLVQLVISTNNADTIFSTITQFFPGRVEKDIRSRYLTLDKWLKRHPMGDIANTPRHDIRKLSHRTSAEDLNKALQSFKICLQSQVAKLKKNMTTKESKEEDT